MIELDSKIAPDGSQVGLMSVEQAKKLSGVEEPKPEPPKPEVAPGVTPEVTPEVAPEVTPEVAPEPDEVITVGGISKPTSQWVQEMENTWGVDTAEIPSETKKKMLEGYIDHAHKGAWQKSQTEKSQQIAAQGRDVYVAEQALRLDEQRLAAQLQRLRATQQKVSVKMNQLQQLRAQPMSATDLYGPDGILDTEKLKQYNRIQRAEEDLPDLIEQQQQLEQEAAQAERDRVLSQVSQFQLRHPEYATSADFPTAFQMVEIQRDYTHPDTQRILDIVSVIDDASRLGVTMDVAYQRLLGMGRLAVKATQPTLAKIPLKTKNTEREKLVAQIAEKQKTATRFLDGAGGGNQSAKADIPLGDRLREAADKAMGASKSPGLTKLGY